jgi:arginase family enzyme
MLDNSKELKPGMVAVIGIPFDANSSYPRGSALAPAQIRKIWSDGAINLCSESGIDLSDHPEFIDLGDMKVDAAPDAIDKIDRTHSGPTSSACRSRHRRIQSQTGSGRDHRNGGCKNPQRSCRPYA